MTYPVEESDYKNRLDLGQKLMWGIIAKMLKGLRNHFGEESLVGSIEEFCRE